MPVEQSYGRIETTSNFFTFVILPFHWSGNALKPGQTLVAYFDFLGKAGLEPTTEEQNCQVRWLILLSIWDDSEIARLQNPNDNKKHLNASIWIL